MKRSLFLIFIVTFILSFCILQAIGIFVELKPGESIGKGWYLIKSYDEKEVIEGNQKFVQRSIKHGNGTINLSILISFIVLGIYLLLKTLNYKKD